MKTNAMAEFDAKYEGTELGWTGGDAENFEFFIKKIILESGDVIQVQQAGVTAIVGSNNAGKSTILREVNEALARGTAQRQKLSVASVELSDSVDVSDLFAWLGKHATFVPISQHKHHDDFVRMGISSGEPRMAAYRWAARHDGLHEVAPFVCFYGDAQGRFGIGSSAAKRQETGDAPNHPVHVLEDSKELRDKLSDIAQRVFHQPLTLDNLAGNVRIRVGSLELPVPSIDNIPLEYKTAMASLRPLDEQGDGMRSFFGQILPIIAATYPLVILDEPEAFLHPPQARALGLELGKLAKDTGVQVIIATHDRNFLTGLLDADGDVSVVRVSRENEGTARAHQLDAEELRQLWSDPVLKYTNVLDALFHRVAVLAEAEVDCGFLSAAMDSPLRKAGVIPNSEFLFVQTGGKAGLPKVASALKAVGVPVVAAPDFDLIRDKNDIKRLTEALDGQWSQEDDNLWNLATNSIRGKKSPAKIGLVLESLIAAFKDRTADSFTSDVKEEFNAHTRAHVSPWAEVKKHGIGAFDKAERKAMETLLVKLAACGIVPVRQGELERLAPEVAVRKGSAWLAEALKQNE